MLLRSNSLHRTAYLYISFVAVLIAGCSERNSTPSASTTPISIAITPAFATIAKGRTASLTAMATYPDGTTTDITRSVVWTTANPAIASVNDTAGAVTGVDTGSTTIIAALSGVTSPAANLKVTAATLVSISIAPDPASVVLGGIRNFTATGTFSDSTTIDLSKSVTWKSGNTGAATISREGIATGVGAGKSSVIAKLRNITSNAARLTVAYSIGGTLSGLAAGNSIMLSNNGVDNLVLTADGSFTFPIGIANGNAYNLSIAVPPTKQPCTHTYGAGNVQTANVTALIVICGLPPRGEMVETANLATARRDHTITLLRNGKVLVTGGVSTTNNLTIAELYDPTEERWSPTGSLATARRNHTATLLRDGKVLVVGGLDTALARLASAELYDAVTQHWAATGKLTAARSQHTATLLPNGKALVTGGVGMLGSGTLSSAELYDPVTGRWTATGSLSTARSQHTAMLLPNGKVLVTGGVGTAKAGMLATAELYDPVTGRWSSTGSLTTARSQHTTTLLPNGQVLVAGGIGKNGNLASAELYDPGTGHWSATGSLSFMRFLHTANLLPTGKVLVTGGVGATGNLSSAELYEPDTGRWITTGSLSSARSQHTATLLSDGKVLVAGGNGTSVLADAELYW